MRSIRSLMPLMLMSLLPLVLLAGCVGGDAPEPAGSAEPMDIEDTEGAAEDSSQEGPIDEPPIREVSRTTTILLGTNVQNAGNACGSSNDSCRYMVTYGKPAELQFSPHRLVEATLNVTVQLDWESSSAAASELQLRIRPANGGSANLTTFVGSPPLVVETVLPPVQHVISVAAPGPVGVVLYQPIHLEVVGPIVDATPGP